MGTDEYLELKNEFLDQTKEFNEALERLSKGDLSINNMKNELRKAISIAFNTVDIIRIFGLRCTDELELQLNSLNEDYKLKRITTQDMEQKRLELLNKLKSINATLSKDDLDFLEHTQQQELSKLDSVID
jgi:hypothetical protein